MKLRNNFDDLVSVINFSSDSRIIKYKERKFIEISNFDDYFEELKTKGTEAFKEHFAEAEKTMSDLFGKKDKKASNPS